MSDDKNVLRMYVVTVDASMNDASHTYDVHVTAPDEYHAKEFAIAYETHDPVGYVEWLSHPKEQGDYPEYMDDHAVYSVLDIRLVEPEHEAAIRKYHSVSSFDAYIRDKLEWMMEAKNYRDI
tara:strand:+ start:2335 stop:2700 length:366 start_codon:yes stop_codon:yes gene_type:complete